MDRETTPTRAGDSADRPTDMPPRGWFQALRRVWTAIGEDHLSTLSAGVAFFGLFAIFPAIAAIVMLAGIVIQPPQLQSIIESLAAALPEEAASIIIDQVSQIVSDDTTALGVALALSLGLSLFSASAGMRTLMDGLNAANKENEKRGLILFYATGLGLTLLMILGFILASGIILAIPIALELFSVAGWADWAVSLLRWPIFALLTIAGLGIIYRFGPSRRPAKWRWLSPGALAATALWVAFSAYVRNFGSYTETYGALAGVIILMTWLWLSAFIVLLGAELNAELEFQTERDSTVGPPKPMGFRGAVVADTIPDHPAPDGPYERHGSERSHGIAHNRSNIPDSVSRGGQD